MDEAIGSPSPGSRRDSRWPISFPATSGLPTSPRCVAQRRCRKGICGGISGGNYKGSETAGLGASFLNYQCYNDLLQYARRDLNPQPSVPKYESIATLTS